MIYRSFCWKKTNKKHVVERNMWLDIKRLLLTIKNRHLHLVIFMLFYVWEGARVWLHWNYSLDTHLNYLGPVSRAPNVSWFSASWIPLGAYIWSLQGAHGLTADDIPCLLKWQAAFPFHGRKEEQKGGKREKRKADRQGGWRKKMYPTNISDLNNLHQDFTFKT